MHGNHFELDCACSAGVGSDRPGEQTSAADASSFSCGAFALSACLAPSAMLVPQESRSHDVRWVPALAVQGKEGLSV